MSQFIYQQKQAWASLKKKPGFLATVVTTMGTTLGALLCILTLAYLLLMEPLPYPEQNKLYTVDHALFDKKGENNATSYTYPGLIHLYENQDVFEQVALVYYGQDVLTSLPNQPTMNTTYVTPEWLNMLDAPMAMGRRFEATEAIDTNNPVAIISYQTWRDEFNLAADILDQKVSFSGRSYNVVGVLGESFVEPQIRRTGRLTGVWFPWDYNLATGLKERWTNINGGLTFIGKLKDGITKSQAEQAITPIVNDTWVEKVAGVSFFAGWKIEMQMTMLQSRILGDSETTVYLLLAGVLGLVIIAFANIANLFMSRTAEQQRQLAIYAALGAKKSQLFRTLLAESGLLMVFSIGLALAVSALGFHLFQEHLSRVLPRVDELAINGFTLAWAVGFAAFFAVLFAALSAKMINYRALNSMLQSSGKGTGIQVSKGMRQLLIVSQVAIATVLVFANVSLFKEAVDTITEPMGYNIDNKAEVTLSVSAPEFPPTEEVIPVMTEWRKKMLELPQVESISMAGSVLRRQGLWALTDVKNNVNYTANRKSIDSVFIDMMGMELLEGDFFSEADIKDRNRVMIVNDVFANRLNPEGSAVGMQISPGGPDNFTIVGVVKGIKMPGANDIPIRVYVPSSLASSVATLNLVPGQTVTREQMVSVLQEVSGMWSIFGLENLKDTQKRLLFTEYTTAYTTAILAILTLFLAGVGLYGILSYSTQMRRFELGTRMAIGATKKHLTSMIVRDNSTVIVTGLIVSIVILALAYIGFSDAIASYMGIHLVTAFIVTVVAIVGLSLFACYWPLREFINKPAIMSLRGSD